MTENAKTRQNAYFEMTPKQEHFFIHTFRSFQCISVCQETFFSVAMTGEEGGGAILDYALFWAPGQLTGPNWHIAHKDHVYHKIILQLDL